MEEYTFTIGYVSMSEQHATLIHEGHKYALQAKNIQDLCVKIEEVVSDLHRLRDLRTDATCATNKNGKYGKKVQMSAREWILRNYPDNTIPEIVLPDGVHLSRNSPDAQLLLWIPDGKGILTPHVVTAREGVTGYVNLYDYYSGILLYSVGSGIVGEKA